jgi:hypothetical protein
MPPVLKKITGWIAAHSVWIIVVGIAVLVLILVVVLSEAAGATTSEEFWSIAVPGTLTGVGTLALAGGTVLVLIGDQADRRAAQQDRRMAQYDRRLAEEDRRRRDEQDRRAQAARVQVAAAERYNANLIPDGLHASYTVDVTNESHDTIGRGTIISVIDPPWLRLEPVDNPVIDVRRLIAGRRFADSVTAKLRGSPDEDIGEQLLVWFTFLDAAGNWWVRDPEFRLIEITEQIAGLMAAMAREPDARSDAIRMFYDQEVQARGASI